MNSLPNDLRHTEQAACPRLDVFERAVRGETSPDEEAMLGHHLVHCEACRQRLDALLEASDQLAEIRRLVTGDSEQDWNQLRAAGLPQLPHVEIQADRVVPSNGLHLAPPRAGQYLASVGRFDVLAVIAHGGMGTVLRAWDDKLQREIALKVMGQRWVDDPAARQRFLQEARAAAGLRHPNIVTVHEVDEFENLPFIVMEYVCGTSLDLLIAEEGQLASNRAARIARETLAAVEHAHGHGVIHRDIKPGNILLEGPADRVRLVDFGLAHSVADAVRLTGEGFVPGTPWYMSPEQASGSPSVDARSDLFAMGVVLFEMLTGTLPFLGPDVYRVLEQIRTEPAPDVHELNPAVPPPLAAIVRRALEKSPAARYQSAAEFAGAIDEFLKGTVESPPAATGRFVECSACHRTFVSKLSMTGACLECGKPICFECVTFRSIRHCACHAPGQPSAQAQAEPEASPTASTAADANRSMPFNNQAADDVGRPSVGLVARSGDRPQQKQKDRPQRPDVEEMVAAARAAGSTAISARQAKLAEQTFFRLVEDALQDVTEVRDPYRGVDVPVKNWRRIRRQTDLGSQFLPKRREAPRGAVSPSSCPRAITATFDVRQRNLVGRVRGQVIVEVRNLARIGNFSLRGYDDQPMSQMELEVVLNDAARRAAEAEVWHLLILASPTGWPPEAVEFVTGKGPRPFRHRLVSVVLFEHQHARFLLDETDDKLSSFRDALSADLHEDTFTSARRFVEEHLVRKDFLELSTLVRELGLTRKAAERVFRLLALSGDFRTAEMEGIGKVLSRPTSP